MAAAEEGRGVMGGIRTCPCGKEHIGTDRCYECVTSNLRAQVKTLTAERNAARQSVQHMIADAIDAEHGADRLRTQVRALQKVARAAAELQASGYDGPFIGEVCEPLFDALAALDPSMLEELGDD